MAPSAGDEYWDDRAAELAKKTLDTFGLRWEGTERTGYAGSAIMEAVLSGDIADLVKEAYQAGADSKRLRLLEPRKPFVPLGGFIVEFEEEVEGGC